MSCVDNTTGSNHVGIEMFTHEAFIYGGSDKLNLKYSENDVIEFEFNITNNQEAVTEICGYEDGVPTRHLVYDDTFNFTQVKPKMITLGSDKCDLHIYRLKVYNTSLTDRGVLNNFIADAIGLPGSPSSTWFCIHFSHSKGYVYPSQIAFEYAGLKRIMYRTSIKGVWGTWRKISTTGVKDIPKTNIAPADTTKFVGFKGNSMCNYCVQNGICYVSLWGVQVTVTGRVNTGVILPLPKSGFFGGGYLTGGGDAITHAYAHTIPETGELKFNVKDANTALYGAFSYPVAES